MHAKDHAQITCANSWPSAIDRDHRVVKNLITSAYLGALRDRPLIGAQPFSATKAFARVAPPMPTLSDDDRFNLEVLKLLLTVAWVDGEVDQTEANMVMGLGRSWTVPEGELQHLMQSIKLGQRPAEPDYALLRTRPDDALQAARALMLADGKAKGEEISLLKKVKASLEG
jgi:uncharacterized membrane protein YebE (DUF533 family)